MLKQDSYDWAKEFLNSPAWNLFQKHFSGNSYSFSLPSSKPSVVISHLACPSSVSIIEETPVVGNEQDLLLPQVNKLSADKNSTMASEDKVDGQTTPPPLPIASKTPPKGKRGKAAPISKANLRSDRVHNQHKGFKTSVCKDRNCFGCSPDPPVLSPSVVRDLGATFCSIDPSKLTDDCLNVLTKKSRVVGRPSTKKLRGANDSEAGPPKQPKSPAKEAKSPHKEG